MTTPVMPARIAALPRDGKGRPVPWFVAWLDDDGHEATPDTGTPDFRIVASGKLRDAIVGQRCWVCGGILGQFKAFVIGPMCAVNRVSAEPPSHRDCAVYAAQACPFLTTPQMRRREGGKPATVEPAGTMIRRNPGVALVWVTRSYQQIRDPQGGVLLRIGDPTETLWFAHGRPATRAEVTASIDSGLPILREMATQDGPKAVRALERQHADALRLLPPATVGTTA